MKFLVWANRICHKLDPMTESAAYFGIEPEFIGKGSAVNDMFKMASLHEATKNMEPDEVVCATDGYDVFFQRTADSIRETFQSFSCDVVYAAERGYTHQYGKYRRHYDNLAGPSPYRYLNAGCVIGYAGSLRKIYGARVALRLRTLRSVIRTVQSAGHRLRPWKGRGDPLSTSLLGRFYFNDQALVGRHIARNPGDLRVRLDYDCSLFWCTAYEWDEIETHYRVSGHEIRNRNTNQSPACIHVPWEDRYRHVFMKLYEVSRRIRVPRNG